MSALPLHLLWRFIKRDWRSGDLLLLALSLMVAVAAVSSVSFFADRVQAALDTQASELLAADLVLSSRKPLPEQFRQTAAAQPLRTAETLETRSVAIADNDESLLVEIKAVGDGYPLYGKLKISTQPYAEPDVVDTLPAAGEVWVESNLLNNLRLAVGDRLQIGDSYFVIGKVLQHEPDRGGGIYQLGPRVLMRRADLDATGLLGPISLVNYKLLLAGSRDQMDRYTEWAKANLNSGVEMQTVENARPEIRNALQRARQFLGLAVIVTVIVASVAVAMIARHFSERQADAGAILKCLGATRAVVRRLYLLRLLLLALVGSAVGSIAGYVIQGVLARAMAGWFVVSLPAAGWLPWAAGIFVGLLLLIGFALPPVWRLSDVTPLRVIRRDLGMPNISVLLLWGAALAALALVVGWLARDIKLAVITLSGVAASVVVGLLLAFALLALLQRLPRRGLIWRYGLSNLLRHRRFSVLQLTAFSLSLMALLLLTIVRVDLLSNWQLRLSQDTPNHFLINIQAEERDQLRQWFVRQGLAAPTLGPVVVARLTAVNGKPVNADDYPEDSRARWISSRDQRLSYVDSLPSSNQVVAGAFWNTAGDAPQWSFEKSYAEGLDLNIGDVVEFRIADTTATAPITSLREVSWDSMQINFFVLGTPAFLQSYPATYLTSFYLPPQQGKLIAELARQFTGVTIIDVRAVIDQVRSIADRASLAVRYIFLFTLCACVLVLYAGIYASRDARERETALLRALGSTRKAVLASFAVEFSVLGLLAGVAAALISAVAAYFIAIQVFNMAYHVNWSLLGFAVASSVVVVALAGVLGVRSLLAVPPMRALTRFELN